MDGPRARPTSIDDVLLQQRHLTHGGKRGGKAQRTAQGPAKKKGHGLTLIEIAEDKLTKVAAESWSDAARKKTPPPAFKPELVKSIYQEELGGKAKKSPPLRRVMLLEISQYLENYLWPNFEADSSDEHVISIMLMVNEKFRENIDPWLSFKSKETVFPDFFKRVLALLEAPESTLKMHEKTAYLLFTINIFQSLENEMVRGQALRLVSLPLWMALSSGRLQLELHAHPQLAKHWKSLQKKDQKQRPESRFIPAMLDQFLDVVQGAVKDPPSASAPEPMEVASEKVQVPAVLAPDQEDDTVYSEDGEEEEDESESDLEEDEAAEEGGGDAAGKPGAAAPEGQAGVSTWIKKKPQGSKAKQQGKRGRGGAKEHAPKPPPTEPWLDRASVLHCERSVELLIDLLSQLPTRRFVRTLVEDRAILIKCRLSRLYKFPGEGANLFRQLIDLFQFYMAFPIDDHTGEPQTDDDVASAHYEKVCQVQRLAFKHWPQLKELALSNCGSVEKRDVLKRHLAALTEDELRFLVTHQLRLVAEDDPWAQDKGFLTEVMLSTYERRRMQREVINEMPLYPTEGVLWDENQIPSANYTGESCLALPKLNLQFLTDHDYLLRNFNLFRLEATYEIREDIANVLGRVGAFWDDDDFVRFAGWARMSLPVGSCKITEVRKPSVDENKPAAVTADIVIDTTPARRDVRKPSVGENKPAAVTADIVIDTTPARRDVRGEWDELKQHDVLFLLTIRPPSAAEAAAMHSSGRKPGMCEQYGLVTVRGCEVIEMKDEGGRLINDFTGRVKREEWKPPTGCVRTLTVAMDTAQYQMDMNHMVKTKGEDVYGSFNLLMRRKPKENNFKAVLESIRDLMNEDVIIPPWLHDIFLGYGDPAAAQYTAMEKVWCTVDFKDIFLGAERSTKSFPYYDVQFTNKEAASKAGGISNLAHPIGSRSFPPTPSLAMTPSSLARRLPPKPDTLLRTVDFKDTFLDAKHLIKSFPHYDVQFTNKEAASKAGGISNLPPPYRITFPEEGPAPLPAASNAPPGAADASKAKPILKVESYTPPDPGPYPQNKPRQNTVRFTPVQVEAINSGVQPGLTMVVGPPGTGKTDTAVQIMNVLYHNCPGQRTLLITHSNQALNDLFQKILERDVPSRYLLRLGMGEQELDTEQDFSRVGRVNASLARRLELLSEVEKLSRQFGVSEDVAYTCETAAYFWLMHVMSRWEKFMIHVGKRKGEAAAVAELFPFKEFFADAPEQVFSGKTYEEDMERARGCFRHLKTIFQELEEIRPFELMKGQSDRINYLMTKQAKVVAMTCTHAALKRSEFVELAFKYDNLLMEEAAQILEIETFIPMLLVKKTRQEDGVSRLKRVCLIGDHHQLPPVVKNMAFQKYSHLDQSLFTRFIRLGTPYVELNAQGRARPSMAKLYNWRYRALGDLPNVNNAPAFALANPGFAHVYQFIDVPDYMGKGETEPTPYFYQNLGEAEYLVSVYCFMRLMGYPANKISVLTTYNGQKALLRDVTTVDKYQGQQNDIILLSLVRTRVVGHLRDVRRLVVAMSRSRYGLYIFGRQAIFAECYELQPTFKPTQLALVKGEAMGACQRKRIGGDGGPGGPRCSGASGCAAAAGATAAADTEEDRRGTAKGTATTADPEEDGRSTSKGTAIAVDAIADGRSTSKGAAIAADAAADVRSTAKGTATTADAEEVGRSFSTGTAIAAADAIADGRSTVKGAKAAADAEEDERSTNQGAVTSAHAAADRSRQVQKALQHTQMQTQQRTEGAPPKALH
eukprot:gene18650-25166_t